MSDELAEKHPEAAPLIREAVADHDEDWVIKNYNPKISSLGVVLSTPDVEELPFYDEERHDVMSDEEKRETADALG